MLGGEGVWGASRQSAGSMVGCLRQTVWQRVAVGRLRLAIGKPTREEQRMRRIIGLSLVAVFAVGVMASTASAAQPVFYGVAELGKVVGPVKQSGTLGPA